MKTLIFFGLLFLVGCNYDPCKIQSGVSLELYRDTDFFSQCRCINHRCEPSTYRP